MDESYLLFCPSPAGDVRKPQALENSQQKRNCRRTKELHLVDLTSYRVSVIFRDKIAVLTLYLTIKKIQGYS